MRWLGVWLPHWELDYLRHVQGLAPSMPLILYDVAKARVVKACPQAASAGIAAGQSMGSAAQLCPDVQPFPYEASLHRQGSEWLCRHGYSFSARLVPPPASDEFFARCHDVLLLETGSMAKLFGGEAALAKALAAVLEGLNCSFAMAFAVTPLAAGVLAKARPCLASKTLQSGFAKAAVPQSAVNPPVVNAAASTTSASEAISEPKNAAAALPRLLSVLPISTLPVPEVLLSRLEGMGLEQIGALQALPAAELGIRFGPEFVRLLARLTGKQPHPQSFYCPQDEYRQRLELMYEAESLNALVFVLGRMFAELALFLRQRQLAVSMLELVLHYRASSTEITETTGSPKASLSQGGVADALPKTVDGIESAQASAEVHEARLSLAYPFAEYTADGLLALCRLQLERFTLAAPVVALTLHRCHFSPRRAPPAGAIENCHRASLSLLARLEARLGANRVRRLGARQALLPEHSFCLQPMSAPVAVVSMPFSAPSSLPPQTPEVRQRERRSEREKIAAVVPVSKTAAASNVIHTGFSLPEARESGKVTVGEIDGANDDLMVIAPLTATNMTAVTETAANEAANSPAATKDVVVEGLSLACRPPWLLVAPEAIAETDVELLRGPERLREPWWHGSQAVATQSTTELDTQQVSESVPGGKTMGAARDYYLARHVDGGLCWVFRREGETGLYLQGWF